MDGLVQSALSLAASLLSGLVPVVLFLFGLRLLDSFKLVGRADVAGSLAAGAIAAVLAFIANTFAIRALHVTAGALRQGFAPVLEETLKAASILVLLRRSRIGFLVDAAIHGFAIGTGFALVENVYYAVSLRHFDPAIWTVRGLGTAIMHGSTTAIVAMLTRRLLDRRPASFAYAWLPGLALAIAVHALYNRLLLDPLVTAIVQLVTMPLLMLFVFDRSERATADWLGSGFDGDVERLEQLLDGEVAGTPIGHYLESLRSRFDAAVLVDMLCMLRIRLELSLRAKGVLIARAAGVELPPDPALQASFEEMRFLERSLGATGRLALQPLLGSDDRALWQLGLLKR
jgi:RsiW-degrading membrane proteinase PrsW (M82 family)